MACRFPGDATNVENFWDMIVNEEYVGSGVPKDRFNVNAFYHPNGDRNGSVSTWFC